MTRDLTGRVAVVTGVTSGIGRAVARRLLATGATVVGAARDAERLAQVAESLPGLVPRPGDLRDADARAGLVGSALDRFGRVDVLVNNAGVGFFGPVVDMTAEDVERIVSTNTTAALDLTRLALPGMLARGDGDLLFVTSSAAWVALPPLTVYAASKRGTDAFVEGLRREVHTAGVRVHAVAPGAVATEFLARAQGVRPREDDPGVRRAPGVDPERVARVAVRELASGRGRTVAVPRVMGLGRLVGVAPFTWAADATVRLARGRLTRLAGDLERERTPRASG